MCKIERMCVQLVMSECERECGCVRECVFECVLALMSVHVFVCTHSLA